MSCHLSLSRVCLLLLSTCGLASCKWSTRKAAEGPRDNLVSPRPTLGGGVVDGAPLIDVAISTRSDGTLVLGFRMFSGDEAKLARVRVARVNDPRESCEIVAKDGPHFLNEWAVGSKVPGFQFVECSALGAGEYEAYAFGVPGDGVRRFLLGRGRSIKVLPWSDTEEDPSPIPLTEAQRLRLKQDGGVGDFDKRAVIPIDRPEK